MPYTPLSSSQHSKLRLTRGTFFHLQDKPMVPVSIVEAQRAGLDLPLAFPRTDKGLSLMAMLSLDKEDNAHVGPKGLWMGGYMPAVVRAYPFALAFQGDQATVLVDTDSDWLSESQGKPLFDEDGSTSEALDNLIKLLKNQAPNPNRDGPVLQAIEQSDILEPWAEVSESLLRVSPEKLASLNDQAFLQLRKTQALPAIYAHLMSLPRVNRIKNLAERKKKMAERQVQQHQGMLDNEDFGLRLDDDIIHFD